MSDGGGGAEEAKAVTAPAPPTIFEDLFGGAADVSPGPTTLVSSFLNDDRDGGCPTFSQHLTGVMASPVSAAQQRRPPSLVVSRRESMSPFSVLPPAIFSPNSGPGGISHQQSLAQGTSQDAQSHSQMHILPDASNNSFESGSTSHCNRRSQPASLVIDKIVDDGYNWRKYGQKQVKGGECPRSYYKCTHPNCPVTKKVERSLEGQVTEIIYKGQHNHQKPLPNRRSKESNELNGNLDCATSADTSTKRKSEFGHGTSEQLPGSSDDEEGDADSESEPKKRAVDVREMEPTSSHRTVTELRIIVQTRSEVDLLDDGFRWRKYGQKVVKGNPHPRSYYRCTSAGCHVRKHVERASTDPKEVITAYEGKHNHETPAARNSSHNTANSGAAAHILQPKVHSPIPSHQSFFERGDLRNNVHRPVAVLQLKEHSMP